MKTTIKATVTVAFTTIFSFLGILATPIFLLLGCNIIDYITGLAAAAYRNPDALRPITSYKSIKGIAKKVCMYLLVIVGWMVDDYCIPYKIYGIKSIPTNFTSTNIFTSDMNVAQTIDVVKGNIIKVQFNDFLSMQAVAEN